MSSDFNAELMACIPALRGFARGLTRQAETADDLAHDAVARALKARDQYTRGTNFKAWIFTIARNLHVNNLRRRKFEPMPLDDAGENAWSQPPSQPGRIEIADLMRAMDALPPEQREALILVGAQGFSYEDAAEMCECAVGTIKSRLSRARRHVFAALSGDAARRRTPAPVDPEPGSPKVGRNP